MFKKRKKATAMPAVESMRPGEDHHASVSVRAIDNGFIASHHHSHTDANGNYKSESHEMFHRTNPVKHARVASMFKRPKRAKGNQPGAMTAKSMG